MANRWYVALDGEELGPLSDTGLERLIQGGRVDGTTMVRNGTSGEWLTVELAEEMLAAPPRGSARAKRPFKPLKRRDWPRERRRKTDGRAAGGTARSRSKLRPRRPRQVLPTTRSFRRRCLPPRRFPRMHRMRPTLLRRRPRLMWRRRGIRRSFGPAYREAPP